MKGTKNHLGWYSEGPGEMDPATSDYLNSLAEPAPVWERGWDPAGGNFAEPQRGAAEAMQEQRWRWEATAISPMVTRWATCTGGCGLNGFYYGPGDTAPDPDEYVCKRCRKAAPQEEPDE